jgi:hypothetical protein
VAATVQGYVSKEALRKAIVTNTDLKVYLSYPNRESVLIVVSMDACHSWDSEGFLVDPKDLKATESKIS